MGNFGAREHGELRRALGIADSTMIVVGSMIGSGIFIVSADIARTVGAPGYLLMAWLVSGLLTVSAALSSGELAGMMPQAGGQYVYLREAYNPLIGFLYGWTLFLVIQSGTIAAVGVAFAKFGSVLIPSWGEAHILFTLGGLKVTAARLVAVASILLLTAINVCGIQAGKLVQNTLTAAKTLALMGLIALGVFVGRNAVAMTANREQLWSAAWTRVTEGHIVAVEPLSGLALLSALGVAMVGPLFSSDAWNNITFTAGEVKNPTRTIPLSLALGTGIVTTLYLLANVAYLLVLPLRGSPDGADALARGVQFATSDRVATAAMSVVFGGAAASLMAALIMISTFGCNNGLILSGARVYYAMARDDLFFRRVGVLNRRGAPAAGLWIQGIWASVLCLSGTYSDLLDFVIFSALLFYILTVGGVFVLRRRRPDADRPYRAFGYPLVPALYIIIAAAIALDLLIHKPRYTWPGLGIVLMGIPVFLLWRRRKAPTQ